MKNLPVSFINTRRAVWLLPLALLLAGLSNNVMASEVMTVRHTAPDITMTRHVRYKAACRSHRIRLHSGQTLGGVLARLDISQGQVLTWNRRLPHHYRARDLRPGDHIIACVSGNRAHRRLVGLRIDRGRHHYATLGHFRVPVHYRSASARSATTLATDFSSDTAKNGISDLRHIDFRLSGSLADALAARQLSIAETNAVNAWLHDDANLPTVMPANTRIDLLLGRQAGDSAEHLLRLRIWYKGKRHELFSYLDKHHRRWELDRTGLGILHLHIETPVDYTRISSGWGWRINPVLHHPEFHKGIDFAAPMGTPVRAAASGVITLAGWHGNYGRLIIVQNTPNTQTRYGHLSRIASGLHDGSPVHAGQIIGYVGSTGLSTGPHLYFELWIHRLRVDPLTTKVNLPVQLAGPVLSSFNRYVDEINDLQAEVAENHKDAHNG